MLPEERRRSSGVVLSVLILTFISFAGVHWQQRQTVTAVHVSGVSSLSSVPVSVVMDSCLRVKRSDLSLADVRDKLERIPFVRSVHVYFDGVRSVMAEVVERRPVAHVVLPSGEVRYLDASGVLLPTSAVRTAHDIPVVISGLGGILSSATLRDVAELLETARRTLSTTLYESISEVRLAGNRVTMYTQVGTWHLSMDSWEGTTCTPDQADVFRTLNVFAEQTGLRSGAMVDLDLRWNKHVVVRNVG